MTRILMQDGRVVEGQRMEYTTDEPWATATLTNGIIIKLRLAIIEVVIHDKKAPNGTPIIDVNSKNLIRVELPEEMVPESEEEPSKPSNAILMGPEGDGMN